jgi:hypothetical protein
MVSRLLPEKPQSPELPATSSGSPIIATSPTQASDPFGTCAVQLGGLRGPHYTDVDLSIHKDFQITERFKVQFRTDFINAFNHVQANALNMGLGSMGQVTSAQPPRNIQLALKLYY